MLENSLTKEQANRLFAVIDLNKDGILQAKELHQVMNDDIKGMISNISGPSPTWKQNSKSRDSLAFWILFPVCKSSMDPIGSLVQDFESSFGPARVDGPSKSRRSFEPKWQSWTIVGGPGSKWTVIYKKVVLGEKMEGPNILNCWALRTVWKHWAFSCFQTIW